MQHESAALLTHSTVRAVRPAGPGTQTCCADKIQQQFTHPTLCYWTHGSNGARNQE